MTERGNHPRALGSAASSQPSADVKGVGAARAEASDDARARTSRATSRIEQNPWLYAARASSPRLRLFCFPYAGASGAVYGRWQRGLPAEVQVCAIEPPGRLSRRGEPAHRNMDAFVTALDGHLSALLDVPYVLFGYSLGSLQAFEWAHRLIQGGKPAPRYLIVGARSAPQVPRRLPPLTGLPPAQFLRELQARYGPLDPLVVQDPDLLSITLQIMRDDMTIFDTYERRSASALPCPILALGGTDDATITQHDLEQWSVHTSSRFEARWITGTHFFIRERPDEVTRLVSDTLQLVLTELGSARAGDGAAGPSQLDARRDD
jgi:medium-chain acyl-[acyl-carrier-protein] hydrolase